MLNEVWFSIFWGRTSVASGAGAGQENRPKGTQDGTEHGRNGAKAEAKKNAKRTFNIRLCCLFLFAGAAGCWVHGFLVQAAVGFGVI